MRAVRIHRTGAPEVLEIEDVELPAPGPGQILVRHEAVGVNFIDTYHRSGLYPVELPSGLGQEGAGVVRAVGPSVRRFKAGDRVAYALGALGSYAEEKLVEADRAVHVPANVSLKTAAAVLLKGMTAEFLLNRLYRLAAGETVLIHAAAGGVGQILLQWAKHIGAVVIATVGSEEKAELVRKLGADHAILYRQQDVAAEVRRLTGGAGVTVAYDAVGKDTFEGTLNSLARRGVFVSYGAASGPAPAIEPLRLMRAGSVYLTRPHLADYTATVKELQASADALFAMIAQGTVDVEIGQTFALEEARAAHEALESRRTVGATLLIP